MVSDSESSGAAPHPLRTIAMIKPLTGYCSQRRMNQALSPLVVSWLFQNPALPIWAWVSVSHVMCKNTPVGLILPIRVLVNGNDMPLRVAYSL